MIDSKENYKFDLGVKGLRCSSGNKSYQTVFFKQTFLKCSLPFTNVGFKKYNKKDRSPCLFNTYDRPNLPHSCLYLHQSCLSFYWFPVGGSKGVKRNIWKRVNKQKVLREWNSLINNLWENQAILSMETYIHSVISEEFRLNWSL